MLVSVDHLVVSSAESVKIRSNPPVFQVPGLILDDGVSGGRTGDEFK